MGFFSSLFNSIKSFFKRIILKISEFLSDVFGSPLVASMAIFVISWVILGPTGGMLQSVLTGSASLVGAQVAVAFVMKYAFYSMIANAILAVLPESFTRALGKAAGFMFIVTVALAAMGVYHPEWLGLSLDTSQPIWAQFIDSYTAITEKLFGAGVFGAAASNIITSVMTTSFALSLTNPEFASGFVDGMLIPLEVVADVADETVSLASDTLASLLPYALFGLGAFWLVNRITTPKINLKGAVQWPSTPANADRSLSSSNEISSDTQMSTDTSLTYSEQQ